MVSIFPEMCFEIRTMGPMVYQDCVFFSQQSATPQVQLHCDGLGGPSYQIVLRTEAGDGSRKAGAFGWALNEIVHDLLDSLPDHNRSRSVSNRTEMTRQVLLSGTVSLLVR